MALSNVAAINCMWFIITKNLVVNEKVEYVKRLLRNQLPR
jgi:hypothetical protein